MCGIMTTSIILPKCDSQHFPRTTYSNAKNISNCEKHLSDENILEVYILRLRYDLQHDIHIYHHVDISTTIKLTQQIVAKKSFCLTFTLLAHFLASKDRITKYCHNPSCLEKKKLWWIINLQLLDLTKFSFFFQNILACYYRTHLLVYSMVMKMVIPLQFCSLWWCAPVCFNYLYFHMIMMLWGTNIYDPKMMIFVMVI